LAISVRQQVFKRRGARGILPFLLHPLNRSVRIYYVVVISRDRGWTTCCIDIKHTRTLYVKPLTYSVGPMVRFSAGSTWYVHRTSVYVYVYVGIHIRS